MWTATLQLIYIVRKFGFAQILLPVAILVAEKENPYIPAIIMSDRNNKRHYWILLLNSIAKHIMFNTSAQAPRFDHVLGNGSSASHIF